MTKFEIGIRKKINIPKISEKKSNFVCSILYIIFGILIILGIGAFITNGINATVKILVLSDTFRWIAYWDSLITFPIFGIIMIKKYRLEGLIYVTTSYIFFESFAVYININPFNVITAGLLQYLTWYFTIFFILIFYRKFIMKKLVVAMIVIIFSFQVCYFIGPTLPTQIEMIYQIIVIIFVTSSIKKLNETITNRMSISNGVVN